MGPIDFFLLGVLANVVGNFLYWEYLEPWLWGDL